MSNTARMGAYTSRRLRAAGFNISSSARRHLADGVFVSGKRSASILVDLGTPKENDRMVHELTAELMTWDLVADRGITSEPTLDGTAALMWVTFKPKAAV